MRLIFTDEPNALFTPGESLCGWGDCSEPARLFADAENDEYCEALCEGHALLTLLEAGRQG